MSNILLTYTNMVKMTQVTPQGPCEWPHLFRPDTKFGTPGNYNITLLLPKKDAEPLMQEIDAVADRDAMVNDKKQRGTLPYKVEGDTVRIRFKQNAEIKMKNGEVRKPTINVVDATLQPIDSSVSIGNGSIVKISYATRGWGKAPSAGCSLDLIAVQVLELKEYQNTGFEAVEGGFTVDSVKPADEEIAEKEVTKEEEEGDF